MRFALAALLILLAAPALFGFVSAAAAEPDFSDGGSVDVARVIDGETLSLSDGRILRLVDIDVPERGPAAAQAKAALAAIIEGQALALKFAGNPKDRQGRVVAELYAGDIWVQSELLRRGLARVAGTADNRIGVPELLAIERRARRYHRGLWADASAAPIAAADAARRAGSFALVTGTVAGFVKNADGVVLYFGADQHHGFVLTFASEVAKLCREAGLDPASLQGKALLTRGYVDGTRRPTIAITFPEQIELLRAPQQKKKVQKKAAPESLPGPR